MDFLEEGFVRDRKHLQFLLPALMALVLLTISVDSAAATASSHRTVGMAATPDGGGDWLVDAGGDIFAFGDAQFYGSTGGVTLARRIVGMVATPDGRGYWLVGAGGATFAFGDAGF